MNGGRLVLEAGDALVWLILVFLRSGQVVPQVLVCEATPLARIKLSILPLSLENAVLQDVLLVLHSVGLPHSSLLMTLISREVAQIRAHLNI